MGKYTAEVIATGGSLGKVKSQNGNLNLDIPGDRKTDTGTNAEQLFAAAYGVGFLATLSMVARDEMLELKEPKVVVKVTLDDDEKADSSLSAAINVVESSLDDQSLADLVKKASAVCPYTKVLSSNMNMLFTANKIDVEI